MGSGHVARVDVEDRVVVVAEGRDLMLSEGTISLQSESHPIEFRKVQLMVLDAN